MGNKVDALVKTVEKVVTKVDDIQNTLSKGEGKINSLNTIVFGKGENTGLNKKVEVLENYHEQSIGRRKLVNGLMGGGWAVTIILFIVSKMGLI